MSYEEPRPYQPYSHSLRSPQSYESLQAPHSASASTFSTPPGSADGRQGAFETLQGDRSRRDQQYSYEQPQQRQRQAVWQPPPKHEAIPMGGGTGVMGGGEIPAHRRKRIILMTVCGLVVVAIIAITVAGCKRLL